MTAKLKPEAHHNTAVEIQRYGGDVAQLQWRPRTGLSPVLRPTHMTIAADLCCQPSGI